LNKGGKLVKVTKEKVEKSQVFLAIEMEPAEVEESLVKSYHRLVKRTTIPGFRKGKTPRAVLERYLGKEGLLEDTLNHLIPQTYEKALKEQQIEPFGQPQIEIVQTDPVIFKAAVPLAPTIKLGDYHQIRLAPEQEEVTKEKVNAVVEQLRHQNATWEPVVRAVEFGDLVTLNIESNIDGESFVNQEGSQYQVIRDSPFPAPGFSQQLTGMKKEEEKEFELQFPADYPRGELAGRKPSFKVKIVEVKKEILPELDDAFARQLGAELKTVAALKKEVADNLKLRAEEKARTDFEERVIDAVVELAQVEFPPVLVEMEVHRLIDEQSRRFQMQGGDLAEYLKNINKTEEQLHEELRPVAARRVTQSLVLDKIAEEEKIEVGQPEVDAEIENMLKNIKDKKEDLAKTLNTPRSRESIKQVLITRKTINRLVEIAKDTKKKTKAKKEAKK
jgi:trigger factor